MRVLVVGLATTGTAVVSYTRAAGHDAEQEWGHTRGHAENQTAPRDRH